MALYYVLNTITVETKDGPKKFRAGDTVDSTSSTFTTLNTLGVGLWPVADTVFAAGMALAISQRAKGQDEQLTNDLVMAAISDIGQYGAQPDAQGFSSPIALRVVLPVGGTTGTGDAPVVLAASPFKFRVVDVELLVTTGIAASTATLSSLSAAGTLYTNAMSTATAGIVRDNLTTASQTVPVGGNLYLQRSDRATAMELTIFAIREQ